MLSIIPEIGDFFFYHKKKNHRNVHNAGKHRSDRSTSHSQARESQFAEDKKIIAEEIGHNARRRTVQRDLDLLNGTQEGAHRRCDDLQRIGKTYDFQIFDADFLNLGAPRIKRHHPRGAEECKKTANQTRNHHKGDGDAVSLPDSAVIARAIILGKKQHASADKAPIARKHQAGKLGAKTHRPDRLFPKRRQHDGIHHAARRG